MATRPEQLHAWTWDHAGVLRRLAATRPNIAIDWPHLIEEVADLGTSQRDAVRSQLLEHCLRLEHSPATDPRAGWHETIIDARTTLEGKLTRTLHRGLRRRLPKLYDQARRNVDESLRLLGATEAADSLPAEYTLAVLLRHGWYRPAATA